MTDLTAALAHADESEDQDEPQLLGLLSAPLAVASTAGEVWVREAEQLTPSGTSGTMLGGPVRAVWHTTEAPSGGRYFDAMDDVLTSKKAEPHLLYDPVTDRLGQYFPLNRSARALRNDTDGGISTNKTGDVCIQIEVVGYASKPFTDGWEPGPNFRAMLRAIRSWGVPDVWPGGRMSRSGEGVSRDRSTWLNEAGHYGHCHVPGNTHWDCGAIDQQALLRAVTDNENEDDMYESTDRARDAAMAQRLGHLEQMLGDVAKRQLGQIAANDPKAVATAIVDALGDSDLSEERIEAVLRRVLGGLDNVG